MRLRHRSGPPPSIPSLIPRLDLAALAGMAPSAASIQRMLDRSPEQVVMEDVMALSRTIKTLP